MRKKVLETVGQKKFRKLLSAFATCEEKTVDSKAPALNLAHLVKSKNIDSIEISFHEFSILPL